MHCAVPRMFTCVIRGMVCSTNYQNFLRTCWLVGVKTPKVAKGCSSGPESFLETTEKFPRSSDQAKKEHVAAVDGSKALHKAAQQAGVPSLPGVSHMNLRWTPLSSIAKTGLDATTRSLCRSLAKVKRDCFILEGGDNCAEAVAGICKRE